MVKIKQGNIWGRLGTGVGKGLADQLPKEIERSRLASGLEDLSKNGQNLTPFQQFAKLSGTPGITPQMIQSGAELLKHQGVRNAYAKKGGMGQEQIGLLPEDIQQTPQGQSIRDVQFGNMQPNRMGQQNAPMNQEFIGTQPQITANNPLRQEAEPAAPWSPEKRDNAIAKKFEDFPNITLPEAVQMVADDERRDLAKPEIQRERDTYLEKIQETVNSKIDKSLSEKLQQDQVTNITGEMKNNIRRGVSRDLRTNPNATVEDVVDKWTNKALDLSKTKSDVDKLANLDWFDKSFKGSQNYDRLKGYAKIYDETGNSEEYYNTLKSKFNLSPQAASSISNPLNKKASEYLSKIKPSNAKNYYANSEKYALELMDNITSKDSPLTMAYELKAKDPFFDQNAFFKVLRENQDELGLTPRQKRDINTGESDFFPTWGDIRIMPSRGKR